MTEQQSWLDDEVKKLKTPTEYESLPTLKLRPNEVIEVDIDFSKPFQEWKGEDAKGKLVTKKIMPCTLNGVRMNWWMNVANPIYREIITLGKTGVTKFKILQTGTQASTKYVLVK